MIRIAVDDAQRDSTASALLAEVDSTNVGMQAVMTRNAFEQVATSPGGYLIYAKRLER